MASILGIIMMMLGIDSVFGYLDPWGNAVGLLRPPSSPPASRSFRGLRFGACYPWARTRVP